MLWVTPTLKITFSLPFLLGVLLAQATEHCFDSSRQTSAAIVLVTCLDPRCMLSSHGFKSTGTNAFGRLEELKEMKLDGMSFLVNKHLVT